MASVAVFGGSFNPPHVAHVLACVLARKTGGVDRVLVVPTYRHAFAKALAPYETRVAMCRIAMGDLPGVEISRAEEELGGESRTLRLLEHLVRARPHDTFRLLVGADILLETHKWHRWSDVVALAPPLVLGRAGVVHPEAPPPVLPEVSSTTIRELLEARGKGPRDPRLEALVPRDVLAYAEEHALYTETGEPSP